VLRHTIRPKDPASLRDLSELGVLRYTRIQTRKTSIFPMEPPPLWLVFVAEGERGTQSRFTAYENHGELPDEGTTETRAYDLHPSPLLESLRNRLVIDWAPERSGGQSAERTRHSCLSSRSPTRRLFRFPDTAACSSPSISCARSWLTRGIPRGEPHLARCRGYTRSWTHAPASRTWGKPTAVSESSGAGPPTPKTATGARGPERARREVGERLRL